MYTIIFEFRYNRFDSQRHHEQSIIRIDIYQNFNENKN